MTENPRFEVVRVPPILSREDQAEHDEIMRKIRNLQDDIRPHLARLAQIESRYTPRMFLAYAADGPEAKSPWLFNKVAK